MKRSFLSLLAAISLLSSTVYAETYSLDTNHSSVGFTIRHLISKVNGRFNTFESTFDYDAKDIKKWKTQATIQATSVDTGIEKRDNHLRTADFFDVQKYPTLTFKSTKVSDVTSGMDGANQTQKAKLYGDLTMRGVTKPVVLDLELTGPMKDPFGAGQRLGVTATGKVNRKDFGITNKSDAAGVLGEDVTIVINLQAVSAK